MSGGSASGMSAPEYCSPMGAGTSASADSDDQTTKRTSVVCPVIPVSVRLIVDNRRFSSQSFVYALSTPTVNTPSSCESSVVSRSHVSKVDLVNCNCSSPRVACHT